MIFCLGGAFNPPTLAHKQIALSIQSAYLNAAVIFLPVSDAYEKSMASAHHRVAMLEAMVEKMPNVRVDDLEVHDTVYQGAISALDRLQGKYGEPIVFVVGMDQAITLMDWKEADRLLTTHRFLIIQRPGTSAGTLKEIQAKYPQAIYDILDLDLAVSSTDYRKTLDPALLDPSVHTYIQTHHLYQEHSWQD